MHNNTFEKNYFTIVNGILDEKSGTINAPISRKENSIIERCVKDGGDYAVTHYCVEKEFSNMSLLNIRLETGRTHQIRVHMSYIGHPIVGDTLYGTASDLIARQALHAYSIKFIHPITKEIMYFQADLPNDISIIINQ